MITGWIEVTEYGKIPPGVRVDRGHNHYGWVTNHPAPGVGDFGRWYTEEQECPECQFRTNINDPMGYHTCPEIKIGTDGEVVHVGDYVYFSAHDKVSRGMITKFKKSTGNTGVRNLKTGANYTVQRLTRLLKASEDEQRHFEQIINGFI